MTSGFNPFGVGAALAVCASLAFLGFEVHTQKPGVTRYDFSVTLPHSAPGADEDGTIILPSPSEHGSQAPNIHHAGPRDQDDDDDGSMPAGPPGANDPIPT